MSEEMTPTAETPVDPFSMAEAYKTYQRNMHRAEELIYDLTKGARGDTSEHDLLLMAVEAIARMTDNTALLPVIEKALAARSAAKEETP